MQNSIHDDQLQFLMQNAGPTIRHLLMQRFDLGTAADHNNNYQKLLSLPEVTHWRALLPSELSMNTVLGSVDHCFENAFGKLLQFGLRLEDIISPTQHLSYRTFLEKTENQDVYGSLARYVVAGYLMIAGDNDPQIIDIVLSRLNALSAYVQKYPDPSNIYISHLDTKVPKAHATRKIIDPVLYSGGPLHLPLIHDVFMFAHLYDRFGEAQQRDIDRIIDYIATPHYQSLDYGYGLVRTREKKWHAMGWSAHMPFFTPQLSTDYFKKGLMFRLALFSRFARPGVQNWLVEISKLLEPHKTEAGRYLLPSVFLPEKSNSYFLNGRHTSLNENRRQQKGRIIESTYYGLLASNLGG